VFHCSIYVHEECVVFTLDDDDDDDDLMCIIGVHSASTVQLRSYLREKVAAPV
jgi:hypothetical protein